MADGPAGFTPDVCVLCYSGFCSRTLCFRLPGFHRLWLYLPVLSSSFMYHFIQSHNPVRNRFLRFGLFRFRSPLLTKSLSCFLFLRVLRCFNSPRSPRLKIFILFRILLAEWVPPFGYHRIKALLAAPRCFSQPDTSFVAS